MTRTVFCNSIAAVALVFFASTAMAGDAPVQPSESVTKIIVTDPATGTSATATKKPPQAYAGDDPNSASKAKTPKGLTTKQKRPVACDCTNCSAAHCGNGNPDYDLAEDFSGGGNSGW